MAIAGIERSSNQPPDMLFSVGGRFDQSPITGRRNLRNSPELFPGLSDEGCEFLHEVAEVVIFLEGQLLVYSVLSDPKKPHITPFSIQRVVDIAERLVRKPEPDQRSYSLSCVTKNRVTEGKIDLDIVTMSFSPNGTLPHGSQDVWVSLQPDTFRRTFNPAGKLLSQLSGIAKEEVKDILSYRGKSPEDVLQITETQQVIYPTFTITSGKAKFQMIFHDAIADCQLSIEGTNYDQQTYSEETELPEIRNKYTILVQTIVSLRKFRRFQRGDLSQQDQDIDTWLNKIASDMLTKAKQSKPK